MFSNIIVIKFEQSFLYTSHKYCYVKIGQSYIFNRGNSSTEVAVPGLESTANFAADYAQQYPIYGQQYSTQGQALGQQFGAQQSYPSQSSYYGQQTGFTQQQSILGCLVFKRMHIFVMF